MKHLEFKIAYFVLLVTFLYVLSSLLPYNWYIQNEKISIKDACVGDDTLIYTTTREPRWGIKGSSFSQVIEITGSYILETTITRNADFFYEPNSKGATYEVTFDKPFTRAGLYGVSTWSTIYPFPFMQVSKYIPPEERMFKVNDCDTR